MLGDRRCMTTLVSLYRNGRPFQLRGLMFPDPWVSNECRLLRLRHLNYPGILSTVPRHYSVDHELCSTGDPFRQDGEC